MVFLNTQGTKVSVTVPAVKAAVTGTEVKTLMDTIITKNVFKSTGGDLVTKHSAYTTDNTQTDLTLA